MIQHFSKETINNLGYYVYVYSDPDTHVPFYVGKGKENRAFNHLKDQSESDKVEKINEIKQRGKEPIIEILAHGLNEETAFKVEAAAIDLIGIKNLTNIQRGYHSNVHGKIEVSKLDARYNHKKLKHEDVKDNIMLIRINRLYRNDMTPFELYEATRGYWKVNIENAKKVEYVLPVYDGLVLEVYEVVDWLPALSTFMVRPYKLDDENLKMRYEFIGKIVTDKTIRKRYINKSVKHFFSQGQTNPVKYEWGKKK